jgi:hypothetical protein
VYRKGLESERHVFAASQPGITLVFVGKVRVASSRSLSNKEVVPNADIMLVPSGYSSPQARLRESSNTQDETLLIWYTLSFHHL